MIRPFVPWPDPRLRTAAAPVEAVTDEIRAIWEDMVQTMDAMPGYGLAGPQVRAEIAKLYKTSVGTRLGQAGPGDDPYDLPRLEMFYFTDMARWRAHLAGRGAAYLAARKGLRAIRSAVAKPWQGMASGAGR